MFYYLAFSFFILSLVRFVLQRQSVLLALLSLEATILSCVFQAFIFQANSPAIVIFILIVAACESALGLTILVLVSRSEETDKLQFIKC